MKIKVFVITEDSGEVWYLASKTYEEALLKIEVHRTLQAANSEVPLEVWMLSEGIYINELMLEI